MNIELNETNNIIKCQCCKQQINKKNIKTCKYCDCCICEKCLKENCYNHTGKTWNPELGTEL